MNKNMVDHPSHYQTKRPEYEAIKVIEAVEFDFNCGTAYRYLARAGKKTIVGTEDTQRIEDLKKAIWYLQREVMELDSEYNPYQKVLDMIDSRLEKIDFQKKCSLSSERWGYNEGKAWSLCDLADDIRRIPDEVVR